MTDHVYRCNHNPFDNIVRHREQCADKVLIGTLAFRHPGFPVQGGVREMLGKKPSFCADGYDHSILHFLGFH